MGASSYRKVMLLHFDVNIIIIIVNHFSFPVLNLITVGTIL